ncbi:MAG: Dps family protein [Chlamydiia bacterium]
MEINIGTSQKNLDEVCESLQNFLATTYALYLKTQNFHWNVRGPEFFSLHKLFEKHYEELAEAVDEIAERIVILGTPVDGTFSGFIHRSAIKESKGNLSATLMLKALVEAHEAMSLIGRPLIRYLQLLEDDVSSDLIIRRVLFHEKAAWMLRSHLKN